jgi:hypothetical protein
LGLALSLAVSQAGVALSSDWVEGNTPVFQVPPNRVQPRYNPDRYAPPPEADGKAVHVTDFGAPGTPPEQHLSPHTLEGNISHSSVAPPQEEIPPARLLPQSAMLAPPETKIVSPKVFRSWLTNTHPDLGDIPKNAVVEVKGQWDDSGHVMHNFGITFTRVAPGHLAEANLADTSMLVVDCAGNVPPAGLAAIKNFVHEGGFLLTTDWALDGCLTRAIPGYISWNGGYSSSTLVDATVVDADPDLLAGAVGRAFWKLDPKCQTVHVQRRDVEVLVRSHQLLREDPDQQGILAVTFNYGKGKVLHLVGHFDNNSDRAFNNALPDPAPGIGISLRQAIAANFAALAIKSHAHHDEKPEQKSGE